MSKQSKKSAEAEGSFDEAAEKPVPGDPRGGLLIDSGNGPVHELDMTPEQRASCGLPPIPVTETALPDPATPAASPEAEKE